MVMMSMMLMLCWSCSRCRGVGTRVWSWARRSTCPVRLRGALVGQTSQASSDVVVPVQLVLHRQEDPPLLFVRKTCLLQKLPRHLNASGLVTSCHSFFKVVVEVNEKVHHRLSSSALKAVPLVERVLLKVLLLWTELLFEDEDQIGQSVVLLQHVRGYLLCYALSFASECQRDGRRHLPRRRRRQADPYS